MTISSSTHSITKTIAGLLNQMTLDEKLAQLGSCQLYALETGGVFDAQKAGVVLANGIGQITRLGGGSTLNARTAAQMANQIQRTLVEKTRLGIPAIIHEECCLGAMVLGGSMFPQMIGLASTFQPGLACEMADVVRKQLRAIGAHQGLAPELDIARDPRWGRVEETFGEDPTLAAQFGVADTQGLQGPDLAQESPATGKHFVGHGYSLGGLNCGPVNLGPHELREIYLAPFQAAIRDGGMRSIMCAYPELDGEVVAASRKVMTDLLRGELGFDGLVVSDYLAVEMIYNYHHAAPDEASAAQKALFAGVDVELPETACYGNPLRKRSRPERSASNGSIPPSAAICVPRLRPASSRIVCGRGESAGTI